ncbi:WD40 repeat-containing protein [Mycena kentingensis (nom. inval.)]|nr:WD40 repeat-containing protein [Mycena kentingensis (nom. inval.)]
MSSSSDTLKTLLKRLKAIQTKYERDIEENPDNEPEDSPIPGRDGPEYPCSIALYALCHLVDAAMKANLSTGERDELLEAAANLESHIVFQEYGGRGDSEGLDFIPMSCPNIVKDNNGAFQLGSGAQTLLMDMMMQLLSGDPRAAEISKVFKQNGADHSNYDPSSRPSEQSTPLAPLTAFTEARCEIHSDDMHLPMAMAATDEIVAVIGAGGWKQRSPTMLIQRLSPIADADEDERFGTVCPDIGLTGIARQLRLDGGRQLAWVADTHRIKSYKWRYDKSGEDGSYLPVHTLDSNGYENAMLLREGGARLFRFGLRGMAMWDVDALPTHGSKGRKIIGKKMTDTDSWRDEDDEIELSEGSAPTTTAAGGKHLSFIEVVENHPGVAGQILTVSRPMLKNATNLGAVDLETQQLAMRFLGHSADINRIATTSGLRTGGAGDPNAFVTACSDGGVRLYDVRQPLPQLAIEHGEEKIYSALYEHIGGQPFIIYGGLKSQQIKVWDVRNRASLYELSTGNNSVTDLAWDGPRQTLLAATELDDTGRSGAIPNKKTEKKAAKVEEVNSDEEDEDEWSDEDDEDDEEEEMEYGWPDDAWHQEKAFGVAFDAGDHRIFRYQFKVNADPTILPAYGDASPDDAGDYW